MRSEELRLALARTLIDAQMDMVDREQEWAGVKSVGVWGEGWGSNLPCADEGWM